ncbi:MFS general substrate transporter [Cutaneotrichosporon oleaginosum]|uniref:MFS general substrate transporter n=1 Tax=Cutaneotrichosporon oleaginosum TaxID=879819 RepID=A0A0J0XGC1_9TREE|nr:MFS general substrate transporter [Cutaneotrichosporon oleaginosum]KLT40108.1 MFS general substrate transporter [Cutaneotrichosporon oleaginosum]TXT04747.1 hypothetical protein COLE_07566 [Cutaneotrichosporon oleaginosum]
MSSPTNIKAELDVEAVQPGPSRPSHTTSTSTTPTLFRSPSTLYRERGTVPVELVNAVLEKGDAFEIVFDGPNDPRNAQNWSFGKKIFQTSLMTAATLWAGIGSAVISGAATSFRAHFGVSAVVAELANGMFILGFALGPQVFGPLSEVLGRKWPLTLGLFLGTMFSIMTAGAGNLGTVIVGRFLGGLFGASPYAIGGGWFHDVYDPIHVQAGVAFFAAATAGGPALGPIIGAGLASTSANYGWRWAEWFMAAFGLLVTFLLAVFMEEAYAPSILKQEAMRRRRETKVWAYHSELDTVNITPSDILLRYVLRPVRMLFTEPLLFVISMYMSFVYALLYMLMAALPVIFGEYRGMGPFVENTPLFSVFVGIVCGGALIILDMQRYKGRLAATGAEALPEERFVPMGLGALLLPIGLFWFAFTGPAQVSSPWPSIIALGFSMCGMVLIFECGIIVIIDNYGSFANSAIAANTLTRSIFGGSFPLFTAGMVHNLGLEGTWSMALLAFIAVALAPIPLIFYHIAPRLRAMSKFNPGL